MGGAHQSDIDRNRLAAAEWRDDTLLQHTQQPRLHGKRHVANLIEEKGAAVGLQQLALMPLTAGAGERAVFVAE